MKKRNTKQLLLASVLLALAGAHNIQGQQILGNTGFEDYTSSVSPWIPHGSTGSLEWQGHTGTRSIHIKDRNHEYYGVRQSIQGQINKGQVLDVSAWVKLKNGSSSANSKILILLLDDTGWQWHVIATKATNGWSWQNLQGSWSADWTGPLQHLSVCVAGPPMNVPMLIDDVTATVSGGVEWLPPAPVSKQWVKDNTLSSEFTGSGPVTGWYPMLGWGPHEYFPGGSNYSPEKGLLEKNGAPQYYSTETGNHWLNGNGQMVIRAVVDKSAPQNANGYIVKTAYLQTGWPDHWDSSEPGGVKWKGNFVSPKNGPLYISAKVRTDQLKGYSTWFAFWIHSQTRAYNNNPVNGTEVDVVEIVKGEIDWGKKSFNVANHWMQSGGSKSQMFEKGHWDPLYKSTNFVDVDDSDYHTYGIYWSTSSMTCYVDGQPYYTFNDHVPSDPVDMMMLLTMEFSKNGWWPGQNDGRIVGPSFDDPNNNKTIREMSRVLVDHVRVYRAQ